MDQQEENFIQNMTILLECFHTIINYWFDFQNLNNFLNDRKFLTIFFAFVFQMIQSNLICNGDFEVYPLPNFAELMDGDKVHYGQTPSNSSCWYRYPNGLIQIVNQSFTSQSKVARLADVQNNPYSLCQTVLLEVNSSYSLSLNSGVPKQVISATSYIYINNLLVVSGRSTDYLAPAKITYSFTARFARNQICIKGSTLYGLLSATYFIRFTPLIDNVSLVMIINQAEGTLNTTQASELQNISMQANNSNQNITLNFSNSSSYSATNTSKNLNESTQNSTQYPLPILPTDVNNFVYETQSETSFQAVYDIPIYLTATSNDDEGWVKLTGNIQVSQQVFGYFQNYSDIYFQGQKQQRTLYQHFTENSSLAVTIYVERTYDLMNVSVSLPPALNTGNFELSFVAYVNGHPIYVFILPVSYIRVVNSFELYTSTLINGIIVSYNLLKALFLSYFVMNIINFYSITLMYNFLCLYSQPSFSHNAIQKLARLFYVRNSLLTYMENVFSDPNLKEALEFSNFVNSTKQRERIAQFYRGYGWFGNMNVTYNFAANNLENLVMMTLIIIRLIFFKFVLTKFIPKYWQKKFENNRRLLAIVLYELISMSPLMVVSAIGMVRASGYFELSQKINMLLQILILFMIVIAPFLLFNIHTQTNKEELLQKDRQKLRIQIQQQLSKLDNKQRKTNSQCLLKTSKKNLLSNKINMVYSLSFSCSFQYSLNILVPVLVIFKSQTLFFVLITLHILILIALQIYNFKSYSLRERIFKGFSLLILFAFHILHLIFFIADRVSAQKHREMANVCLIAGISLIFLIVIGGCIELFDFLLGTLDNLLSGLIKCVKFFVKFYHKKLIKQETQVKLEIKQKQQQKNEQNHIQSNSYIPTQKVKELQQSINKIETSLDKNKLFQKEAIISDHREQNISEMEVSIKNIKIYCRSLKRRRKVLIISRNQKKFKVNRLSSLIFFFKHFQLHLCIQQKLGCFNL